MSMDINIKYSLRPCMVAIRKGGDERKAERLDIGGSMRITKEQALSGEALEILEKDND